MTHKINIDVTFDTPEAATLAFGILHHAAAAVAEGCRKQLIAGMDNESEASSFLAGLLKAPQPREAILALTTRLMRDLLAELAEGLKADPLPDPNRTPAQVVHEELVSFLAHTPRLAVVEGWTLQQIDEVAGWIVGELQAHQTKFANELSMPAVLAAAQRRQAVYEKLCDALPTPPRQGAVELWSDTDCAEVETWLAQSRRNDRALPICVIDAGGSKFATLSWESGQPAAVSDATVGEEVMGEDPVALSGEAVFVGQLPADLGIFEADSQHYLRITVDGRELRCRSLIVHEFVKGALVSLSDFTELCVLGNAPDTVEFYAHAHISDGPVDCVTLRIEGVRIDFDDTKDEDDTGVDFSIEVNGETNNSFGSLEAVIRAYPRVAPTLDAWMADQTLPLRTLLTRARELAGIDEPLLEETDPAKGDT